MSETAPKNQWHRFVKAYAAEHGLTYQQSLLAGREAYAEYKRQLTEIKEQHLSNSINKKSKTTNNIETAPKKKRTTKKKPAPPPSPSESSASEEERPPTPKKKRRVKKVVYITDSDSEEGNVELDHRSSKDKRTKRK